MTTKSKASAIGAIVLLGSVALGAGNTNRNSLNVTNTNGSGVFNFNSSGTLTLPNATGTVLYYDGSGNAVLPGALLANGGASSTYQETLQPTSGGNPGMRFLNAASSGHFNWKISAQDQTSNAFTITPSDTSDTGGSGGTFSTPAVTVLSNGTTTMAGVVTGPGFKSSTSNPASAGILRLANTERINWRNSGNSADHHLDVNASDQLEFNGVATLSAVGILQASAFPALTGDVTTSAGSLATTVAKIGGVSVGTPTGTGNVVMSANPTLTGTVNLITSGTLSVDTEIDSPLFRGNFSVLSIGDTSDSTKKLAINVSGNTSAKTLTLLTAQSTNQSLNVPNVTATDTLATLGLAQTFSAAQTFTTAPILSSTTASQALFTDASKNVVSNAITGSGNVVMSASPTLTGTIGAASETLSGTLTSGIIKDVTHVLTVEDSSDITKNLNFNITGMTTGVVLGLTSAQSTSQSLAIPNITGSDTLATLGLAQTFSAVQTFTSAPVFSSASTSQAMFTNGSKALVSNAITGSGNVVMSSGPTMGAVTFGGSSAMSSGGVLTLSTGATANPLVLNSTNATGTYMQINQSGTAIGFIGSAKQAIASGDSATDLGIGGNANQIQIGTSGANAITIDTSNHIFLVAAASDTTASAANTFIDSSTGEIKRSTSSIRYKKDILEDVDGSLVNKLRPITYASRMPKDKGRFYGFIAEEVEKVDPRMVEHNAQDKPESVRYDRMTVLLTKAMQNQDRRIQALEETVKQQQSQIALLQSEVEHR